MDEVNVPYFTVNSCYPTIACSFCVITIYYCMKHLSNKMTTSAIILVLINASHVAYNVTVFATVSSRCISAVDCGEPQPLQNGSITGESTVYPNVMHLSCDDGFILQGSSKIQCQTNGNWSKALSFCERKQYLSSCLSISCHYIYDDGVSTLFVVSCVGRTFS